MQTDKFGLTLHDYTEEVRRARKSYLDSLLERNSNTDVLSQHQDDGISNSLNDISGANSDVIMAFGEVGLNANMCLVPTYPTTDPYPPKIKLPTNTTRLKIQKIVYDWRATHGTQGLKPLEAPHFRFSSKTMNFFDPKFIHYALILDEKLAIYLKGKTLYVTSGFRTVEYNKHMVKVNPFAADISPHCCGWAMDISATGDMRKTICDAAYDINFGGIAMGPNFVHIDISAYGRWSYGSTPKYLHP